MSPAALRVVEGSAPMEKSKALDAALSQIERHIGQRLPRVTLPDFDYNARPQQNLDQRPPRPARDPRSRPHGHGSRGPGGAAPSARGPQQRRWSGAPRRRA